MSVLFTSISETNPVQIEDVRKAFGQLGVTVSPEEENDYFKLLAGLHDAAQLVASLPDYEPSVDLARFPRNNVKRPSKEEQVLGAAWAHTFSIKDASTQRPLTGKTVCVKDCISVAGVPQLLGTEVIEPWTPTSDATVVTRVLEAGAEIVGTANCENWCQSTSSFSSAYGTVENPHAPGYSAGGSTSGAAALVAGGFVDIAIGADQGGSIRVPAALCGCVGLKPTHGLVPYTGIASNDAVNDHAGPLARTVIEVAQCLDAIAGYDGIDDRSLGAPHHGSTTYAADLTTLPSDGKDLSDFKVGILKEAFEQDIVEPRMRQTVLIAAQKFKLLGATVEEVSIPDHLLGTAIWTVEQRVSGCLTMMGRAAGRRGMGLTKLEEQKLPWTQEKFDKCFPTTKNIFLNGLYLMDKFPALYPKAQNLSRRLKDLYASVLGEYDVLILPTTSFVAPKHGEWSTPIATIAPTIGLTSNTTMFDATGQPAITIPIGWLPAKEDPEVLLPVGMQIVSGLWDDWKVLRAGYAWQQAYNWKEIQYEILKA